MYKMIELKKMRILTVENLYNLSAYQIINIFVVLRSTHVVPKDQNEFVFYINNYINWDQFNQLYDPNWMIKSGQNIDAIACKFGPVLIKAINQRLDIVRGEM